MVSEEIIWGCRSSSRIVGTMHLAIWSRRGYSQVGTRDVGHRLCEVSVTCLRRLLGGRTSMQSTPARFVSLAFCLPTTVHPNGLHSESSRAVRGHVSPRIVAIVIRRRADESIPVRGGFGVDLAWLRTRRNRYPSAAPASCLWYADHKAVHQVATDTNTITENVALKETDILAMNGSDCGVWVLMGKQLLQARRKCHANAEYSLIP